MNPILQFLLDHYVLISSSAFGIYEAIVRRKPTKRTYSVLTILGRLLTGLVPDIKKGIGGKTKF